MVIPPLFPRHCPRSRDAGEAQCLGEQCLGGTP